MKAITLNLPEKKAAEILLTYSGANNYILGIKKKHATNKNSKLTRAQSIYIKKYCNTTPKIVKRWVDIDQYFANKMMYDLLLPKPPQKVYVEKLLVEKDKAYHIWGKFFDSEKVHDFWLPKVAIIKQNNREPVVIDYSKYDNRPPFDHQKEAIDKLLMNDKFILADDMGVGKSTSATIAALEGNNKKVLVVCPASLKINWERELKLYTEKTTSIIEGKKWISAEFVIINYDILKNFHNIKDTDKSTILNENFDLVIIDEAHYISNPKANRTKIINDISKHIDKVWLLTGTPMTSRPINYYNLLNLIDSPVAFNWVAYAIRYCKGYQFNVGNRRIWNVTGASNLIELRDRTKPQVLRRLKEDILDLPEKIITPVYLNLRSKEYEEVMGEYYDWIENAEEKKSLTVQFSKLMKVRQVIADEKVKHTIEMAENMIEQDKKVIIFTNFTNSLNMIKDHFGKSCVKLDGKMSKPSRQLSIDGFQNNEKIKVFVGNIRAAGVGITLTEGQCVIMNDLSFVPSDHAQAEDRSYRYGQKNNVLIYYPIFQNTIDNIVYDILSNKKNIIDTVMGDNEDIGDIVEEILTSINNRK